MTLTQELLNQAAVGGLFDAQAIKRFSPAEIRESIQSLVATEQLDLANALGDAGLSLHLVGHDEPRLATVRRIAGRVDAIAGQHHAALHLCHAGACVALQPRPRARLGCGTPGFVALPRAT
jgi:hypothetical protein